MNQQPVSRRTFNLLALGAIGATLSEPLMPAEAQSASVNGPTDLSPVATPSASYVSADQSLEALSEPRDPRSSRDHSHGAFGNWPRQGTQWVQYSWPVAISTNSVSVYWYGDGRGLRAPRTARLQYWDGKQFTTISEIAAELNAYNTIKFPTVSSSQIRLEFDSAEGVSVGILRWHVFDSGQTPALPPRVTAGRQRTVMLNGKTYLTAGIRTLAGETAAVAWSKDSGPGSVTFAAAAAAETSASFSDTGDYVLRLTAGNATDTVSVHVVPPAPSTHLDRIYTKKYKISSRLWNDRAKALIVNWIPHICAKLEEPGLAEGGLSNFTEAGNKLAGRDHNPRVGPPWSDAYVHNAMESMCIALLVDPQNDPDITAAQDAMRTRIEKWIPIILAAQESDGYLQTRFTLDPRNARHWTLRTEHEGYTAGYFLESAIAHFILTQGRDRRLYDAGKRLADCWANHIGPPPKRAWYDGHEELEQALMRFARLVNEVEGEGAGEKYNELARFLLDCRGTGRNGGTYDQSHAPVIRQYEAVGHAVRAVYLYKAMSDVAMYTNDVDYQSAVRSIWDNMVNRKYYLTGGVGTGETSEGFGADYSLPNDSYCESCSGCGELFFQHSMSLAYSDAKYADLYERTLYNAIMGDIDMDGKNFTYTNALDETGHRGPWHTCPCCVGNIPRTMLQLPTWMYSRSDSAIHVNLYIGSTVTVENVAGTDVELVQETDYPWNGDVQITVNPEKSAHFALHLRSPKRNVSALYGGSNFDDGITSIQINDLPYTARPQNGYIVIDRQWQAGDRISLKLPLAVNTITATNSIAADRGKTALQYGPLVYNVENVDQDITKQPAADLVLSTEWREDLLHGVTVIKGTFIDGSPMVAIPNYARNNRGGDDTRSIVWIG